MSLAPEQVAQAFEQACLAELQALKPGNVHVFAAGHDMTVADFEASASAAAVGIALGGPGVGARILDAVQRTRSCVSCNTNLGIVLLCAPLAQAALAGEGPDLRHRLAAVLASLDRQDAALAFQAIALAAPGGLGEAPEHDVRTPAQVSLREAMAAASQRDRIALQYTTDFADIFEFGAARLAAARLRWGVEIWATTAVYLGFLARFPDSHLLRKFGPAAAEEVRRRAEPFERLILGAAEPEALVPVLLEFDAALKAEGRNPGTSADLTVASSFAEKIMVLLDPSRPSQVSVR